MPLSPPAMSTCPLPNNVAVWSSLAVVMLPVAAKTPCGTALPLVPAELVAPPGEPPVPPTALPPRPDGELLPTPPLPPKFCVPIIVPPNLVMPPRDPAACCSSIGVRKQANPVNDSATPIANQRHTRIIPARLSAKWSEENPAGLPQPPLLQVRSRYVHVTSRALRGGMATYSCFA